MDLQGRAAELFGNSPALRMPEKTLSFVEYNNQSAQIANHLCQKGLRSGDIIAVVSPNTSDMVLVLAGVLKAGMIAAPLNYRFPEHLLKGTLDNLRPQLVLTQQVSFSCIRTEAIASIIENAIENAIGNPVREDFEFPETMERAVSIIHTSASTGVAKAAVHSLSNHWYSALGSNDNIPFGTGDCWLLSLPLYHIGGYALLFRSLVSGGAVAVGRLDDPISLSLQKFPVTHLSVVPTQLYRLLADTQSTKHLRRLKAVLLGGSPAPKSLIDDAIRHNIPLYLSYGSTEMSTQIATSPKPINSVAKNSGQLLPYRELKNAADGELLVKGPCLFKGYLREGAIQPQTDNDGWFHTADIGCIEKDATVTVLGRKDNMFISGGENIHPEEIEKALMMIDGIREALVVAIPDNEYGHRPAAFIETFKENNPNDDTITRIMNASVGKLKTPARYYRIREWNTLPGSQKINRAWYTPTAPPP
ncbi:MAG: o-succinylbenzoate--CoA ligase [Chlorobiaceae bacterium]|nr:o-succinylbenzoate--CoA ligase [Chlorobiaceae bacterium]